MLGHMLTGETSNFPKIGNLRNSNQKKLHVCLQNCQVTVLDKLKINKRSYNNLPHRPS